MSNKKQAGRDVLWEEVERDYRAGMLSVTMIAKKYMVDRSTVKRRAAKYGWQRDLSERVQARVKAQLSHKDVPSMSSQETEEDIIATSAAVGVQVVLSHREDIAKYRDIVTTFGEKLSRHLTEGIKALNKDGDLVTEDVSLDYVAKSLNAATAALEKLIKLERQAFNLDEGEKQQDAQQQVQDLIDELIA